MFDQIFAGGVSATATNLFFGLIFGTCIAIVYRATHKGLSYSQAFIQTLILLTMIVSVVIMVVGSNLARAFSLVGALSIIRFRTVIKDTRDIAFVFFALAIGMATGAGSITIALTGTIFICLVAFILYKVDFGTAQKGDFLLKLRMKASDQPEERYRDAFSRYLRSSVLLDIKSLRGKETVEISFSVILKDMDEVNQFLGDLDRLPGVERVALISAEHSIES